MKTCGMMGLLGFLGVECWGARPSPTGGRRWLREAELDEGPREGLNQVAACEDRAADERPTHVASPLTFAKGVEEDTPPDHPRDVQAGVGLGEHLV